MQLENNFTVPVTLDDTWKLFQDISGIAPCMPGTVLDSIDDNAFTGRVKIKVGAVQMSYRGKGTVNYDDSRHHVVLDLSANETRGAGTAAAKVTAQLTADDGQTRVKMLTDLDLTGRPAQFGRGIMTEVADRLIQQFAKNLASHLSSPHQDTVTSAPGASGSSASSTTSSTNSIEPAPLDLGGAMLPVLAKRAVMSATALSAAVLLTWLLIRMRPGRR
ncbi:SRPBCC family protein [Rhodococcus sp. NPDC059968]|uniref:SRPBCC family protein n=1 Tax=Rhodococcus sp. NPDC059968 TaxID=3347017 RepID=UPI00366C3ADE